MLFPDVSLQLKADIKCQLAISGFISQKWYLGRGTWFFNGCGSVIFQWGWASILGGASLLAALKGETGSKTFIQKMGMLATGGNPSVGTIALMYQSSALVFCFNCFCIFKISM